MFTKLLQNTLEGRDPLCPQRLREVRPAAPPAAAAPTELCAAPQRAEIPRQAPFQPSPAGWPHRGDTSMFFDPSRWPLSERALSTQGRWSSRHL